MPAIRVLWVLKEFGIGGAENLLLEMLPHLPEASFRPVAVTARPLDLLPSLRAAGLDPVSLEASGSLDLRWLRRLRDIVRRDRPDLVHLHLPYTGAGGRAALRRAGVPIVYTEHNVWDVYRTATRWANALTLPWSDAVVAVSERVRGSILSSARGRACRDRLHLIRNGIDVERVRAEAAEPPGLDVPAGAYGAVTTLTRRKGVDVLVQAAARLQRELPGHQCLVAGGGPEADAMRARAREAGASSVRFLGLRRDARSILARLSVVVIASRWEGLPLVLLEAMALGRPIVATAVGGIPEALSDGVSGLLVPPEDPAALSEAVAGLLRDPERAARLGRAARSEAEARWHVRDTARAHLALYRTLLDR